MRPQGAGRRAALVPHKGEPGNAARRSPGSSTSTTLRIGNELRQGTARERAKGAHTAGYTLTLSSVHDGSSPKGSSLRSLAIARPVLCAAEGDIQTEARAA